MKLVATLATSVALSIGCAGHRAVAQTAGTQPATPSNGDIRSSYNEFRYRRICPDEAKCDVERWRKEPWIGQTDLRECGPVRRSGARRCTFIVVEMVPLTPTGPLHDVPMAVGEKMHPPCAGLFRKEGGTWRMLSLYGKCYPG